MIHAFTVKPDLDSVLLLLLASLPKSSLRSTSIIWKLDVGLADGDPWWNNKTQVIVTSNNSAFLPVWITESIPQSSRRYQRTTNSLLVGEAESEHMNQLSHA